MAPLILEAGTGGIDNILKVLRLDFVWRILPRPLPVNKISRLEFLVVSSFSFKVGSDRAISQWFMGKTQTVNHKLSTVNYLIFAKIEIING